MTARRGAALGILVPGAMSVIVVVAWIVLKSVLGDGESYTWDQAWPVALLPIGSGMSGGVLGAKWTSAVMGTRRAFRRQIVIEAVVLTDLTVAMLLTIASTLTAPTVGSVDAGILAATVAGLAAFALFASVGLLLFGLPGAGLALLAVELWQRSLRRGLPTGREPG
jgi:hypothetical protein